MDWSAVLEAIEELMRESLRPGFILERVQADHISTEWYIRVGLTAAVDGLTLVGSIDIGGSGPVLNLVNLPDWEPIDVAQPDFQERLWDRLEDRAVQFHLFRPSRWDQIQIQT